jgi:hypothetical protein
MAAPEVSTAFASDFPHPNADHTIHGYTWAATITRKAVNSDQHSKVGSWILN